MEKKKPVHEIRLGKIRAAIWENGTNEGRTHYSVAFSRLYKDGDQWRDSASFGRNELQDDLRDASPTVTEFP